MTSSITQFIETHIPHMDSPEKVYQLFQNLGYKTLDPSYRGIEAWGLREKDKEFVKEIYAIANYDKRFQILLIELKSSISNLQSSILKNLPLYFEREIQYPFFVITPDYKNYTFVLVEKIREDVGVFKRKLVKLNLDRENAYYTDKWVISNMAIDESKGEPSDVYKTLSDALSIEKVSKIFFDDYKSIFLSLRKFLLNQKINIKQAHEFSHQLLNRIMFIYFIDKKGWLKKSPKFMKWFWSRYLEEKKRSNLEDQFYERWLNVLFLTAFNNRFSNPQYLPQDVRETLSLAPYLNGGLFKENELDLLPINLPDKFMEDILKFFERYNFTIKEDLPLDVEVAVDPQMIGYVYESLANVAEEIYERQDLGIFYTPKVEVDFMCRRSLLEYFSKTTDISKDILYRLLFDEDKTKVERLLRLTDYEKLEQALDNLSVLDPACGSGAFLVGMLNVLVEIYRLIYRHLKREMTDYQLKKRIIGNSLYGVDVMPWAVHSAELRLWLSLMIESDLTLGELKLHPLLPNLDLKLRVGDSLVQEIGGINLNLRDAEVSPSLKRKLSMLKTEKERYYNSDPTAKFKTPDTLLQEELRIFYEILDERIINLKKKRQSLSVSEPEQFNLLPPEIIQKKLFDEKELQAFIEEEKEKIDKEIETLTMLKGKLKEQKPFIWDIDFAEIFGEKGGFDIVIGNPPYVRQEKIAPPNKLRSEVTNEEKREYKEKLLKSIQVHFPFIKTIDKKSDYYVYFYFHGLSLLNEKGTFCFITSNSWLDVGYGRHLQEFLLEYVPIIAIFDNQAKRSFEHADVNTIIALFGAPCMSKKLNRLNSSNGLNSLRNTARFVMFKRPFEDVINTENLLKIEKAETVINTDDFRVYPKKQEDLLEEGWEYPEEKEEIATLSARNDTPPSFPPYQGGIQGGVARSKATKQSTIFKSKFEVGKYAGNKWGGKYLRAPDIFFTILEKGKDKLVRLGDIAEVRFGIKTGANEFFYLEPTGKPAEKGLLHVKNGAGWEGFIEEEFLKPVIKSPRECKSILIRPEDLKFKVFMCHKDKKELKGTNALKYIEWGERQGYHKRPSCRGRQRWWDLGVWVCPDMIWSDAYNDRYATFKVPCDHYADKRFFYVYPKNSKSFEITRLYLNSVIITLFIEIEGISSLGEGVIYTNVYWLKKLPVLYNTKNTLSLKPFENKEVKSIFTELGINHTRPIRDQTPNPLPDRKALDDIVFDILGLTEEERNEVYWAVCELVKNRLEKARSM